MKIKELKREIKGVFKPPVKKYYLGKVYFGTPYFYPRNFEKWMLSFRILREKSSESRESYAARFPHLKDEISNKFSNLSMVRRNKYYIFKLFGKLYLYLSIGYPIMMKRIQLGWKWKYDSIRYEWCPMFQIYFFNLQFCIFWNSPDGNNDRYYEMILWWLKGAEKNLDKSYVTWRWVNKDGVSTWNKDYLL